MDALTICAANYLPFANVLGSSFLKHNPNSKFYLLLVDGDVQTSVQDIDSQIRVIKPSDLDLDYTSFQRMSVYYDVTELSTALKPHGLKYLLDRGSKIAIYLDPDIEVFSELSEIHSHLQDANIALTPHTLNPIPKDGLRPTDHDIMASGTFNLGFIAINSSEQSRQFLSWWSERLMFDCISDTEKNLFTDQRWIDFVPSYFRFSVIRNSGYNVAYWNLHERELKYSGSEILVNNEPLRFFHFSGFRPDKPWILSKYVADKPRVVISAQPVVKDLTNLYGNAAKAYGWESELSIPYGYENLNMYTTLTPGIRSRYRRECIKAHDQLGDYPPLPTDQISIVSHWIDKRTEDSGRLSGQLYEVWQSRPDLQAGFPFATSSDAEAFVNWAYTHGVSEKVLDENEIKLFETPISNMSSEGELVLSHSLGVNVSGYFKGEFGVGQFGRLVAQSTVETGLPVSTLINDRTESRQNEEFVETGSTKLYPVTIGAVNADQYLLWMNDLPIGLRKHSKFVGVWAWEVEDFPKRFTPAIDLVDEIWAISSFVADSIRPLTDKPIFVVPAPIISPEITESLDYESHGLKAHEPFNLFMFDYFSVFNRKNPLDLIEAHKLAFPDGNGPKLVIKTVNASRHQTLHERLLYAGSDRVDILIIDKYLSRAQLHALLNECQTYISLHRSEGYGLTLAEAMSLGKPVIATAYSGNLDFMKPDNSVLIPYELKNIGPDSYPYSPDSVWAQPDIELAAEAIRDLYNDPDLRIKIGSSAKLYVKSEFTLKKSAAFVESRVKALHAKRNLSSRPRFWGNLTN
jgi:glycosyltransferase involved in cell wall biosynthesis